MAQVSSPGKSTSVLSRLPSPLQHNIYYYKKGTSLCFSVSRQECKPCESRVMSVLVILIPSYQEIFIMERRNEWLQFRLCDQRMEPPGFVSSCIHQILYIIEVFYSAILNTNNNNT